MSSVIDIRRWAFWNNQIMRWSPPRMRMCRTMRTHRKNTPFALSEYTKSLTQESSNCKLSKLRTCIPISSHNLVHVSGGHCHMHPSSTSGCAFAYLLHSTAQSTLVRSLYFQPRMSQASVKAVVNSQFCWLGTKANFFGLTMLNWAYKHNFKGIISYAEDFYRKKSATQKRPSSGHAT